MASAEDITTITFKTRKGVEEWHVDSLTVTDGGVRFEGRPTWRRTRGKHSRSIVNGQLYNWNEGRNEGPVVVLSAS